ncbi:hypothetical protein PA10_00261 [Pseudomonas phage pPa_SNUABM_DT01]|nr:hypothetical protein PA10_00261 [Pseudomonas phage pPa_SNUABM_DT01]
MTTYLTEIARYAANLKTLLNNTAALMKTIRDSNSYRAQDVFRTFIIGTGGPSGTGGTGDMTVDNLGQTNNVYLHLKLPITNAQDKVSFLMRMEGYNYGASKIINVAWSGGMNGGSLLKATSGTHPVDVYVDANGNLVCSIFFTSIYYTTVNIETMCQDDSKRIIRGQLQGKVSLASQINF